MTRQAMTDAALAQESWKDWYEEHQAVLDEFFGDHAQLFQDILSITSQAASVKANVGLALRAFGLYVRGEPFDGMLRGQEKRGFLPAVIKNLERHRENDQLQGQKIRAYKASNDGEVDQAVVDRHIAQLIFGVKSPSKAQFAKAQKNNYSISTQSEIDRVSAAMGALDRSPLGRLKVYEKMQERFLRVMSDNRETLAAMEGGDLSQVRRTQILQALGELDGIISALPTEIRAKIGGYTQLAKVDPMDVFKGDQKVSEVRGMSGAIISAWMREGLNIGRRRRRPNCPPVTAPSATSTRPAPTAPLPTSSSNASTGSTRRWRSSCATNTTMPPSSYSSGPSRSAAGQGRSPRASWGPPFTNFLTHSRRPPSGAPKSASMGRRPVGAD
jgi:hypothetical protein